MYVNEVLRHGKLLICQQPAKFHGKSLTELSEEDLVRWPNGCPPDCNCACLEENEYFSIKVDCSSRQMSRFPEVFPENVSQLYLQDNLLTNPVSLDFEILSNLRILNLERNSIKELDFILPKNISVVLLANNSISRFYSEPPSSVSRWSLEGNPWICDCETIQFRKWMLTEKNKITDINATRCDPDRSAEHLKDKVIVYLSEADLCPSPVSVKIIIIISILSFVLLVMGLTIVYYHYHYHIKVWLFTRGFTFLKRDVDQDREKIYDAFVSSADEDFLIVKNYILPELEMKPPYYKLFEPRRDMKAGEMFEHEKEMEEILKSKRIIVLLSQHYIGNNFLMEVFKFAFTSSIEEKVFRFILIIVGDLPPLSDDHLSLRAAMKSTRCLKFGERMFREMLFFAMPKKQIYHNVDDDAENDDDDDDDDVPLLQL